MTSTRTAAVLAAAAALLVGCSSGAAVVPSRRPARPAPVSVPHAATSSAARGHVVVVVLENHSYRDVVGSRSAPYLTSLARHGANLTALHAVTHPSQPNYVALFTGRRLGVTDDRCPLHLTGPNLASQLLSRHLTFAGYSEGLPRTGSRVCSSGAYARKHAPWADFASLPASVNRPFWAFPSVYARLPTVSFVVPDLDDDMHDGSVARSDAWVRRHLDGYVRWARTHDSLLVVTWDEDDHSEGNRIPTVIVGAGVRAHAVSRATTTYSLLRLVEDRYGLPRLGHAATAVRVPLS